MHSFIGVKFKGHYAVEFISTDYVNQRQRVVERPEWQLQRLSVTVLETVRFTVCLEGSPRCGARIKQKVASQEMTPLVEPRLLALLSLFSLRLQCSLLRQLATMSEKRWASSRHYSCSDAHVYKNVFFLNCIVRVFVSGINLQLSYTKSHNNYLHSIRHFQ